MTTGVRRSGVVALPRSEAYIVLSVHAFDEGLPTTAADTEASCEPTP